MKKDSLFDYPEFRKGVIKELLNMIEYGTHLTVRSEVTSVEVVDKYITDNELAIYSLKWVTPKGMQYIEDNIMESGYFLRITNSYQAAIIIHFLPLKDLPTLLSSELPWIRSLAKARVDTLTRKGK